MVSGPDLCIGILGTCLLGPGGPDYRGEISFFLNDYLTLMLKHIARQLLSKITKFKILLLSGKNLVFPYFVFYI